MDGILAIQAGNSPRMVQSKLLSYLPPKDREDVRHAKGSLMARREHHEEPEEAEGGMERWLLTYADMITLLLALFVVLFALSTISTKKFTALARRYATRSRDTRRW